MSSMFVNALDGQDVQNNHFSEIEQLSIRFIFRRFFEEKTLAIIARVDQLSMKWTILTLVSPFDHS